MPLGLHKKCKERIVEVVANALPGLEVKNGQFLSFQSLHVLNELDIVLPASGPASNHLKNIFGEDPRLPAFVADHLARSLSERAFEKDNRSIPLTDIDDFSDPLVVADRIATDFEALPYPYSIAIRLPKSISTSFSASTTEIGDGVRIVEVSEDFRDKFPVPDDGFGRLRGLLSAGTPAFEDGDYCLQVDTEGFVGLYGDTLTCDQAIDEVRSFVGVAMAVGFVNRGRPAAQHIFGGPVRLELIVHRGGQYDTAMRLDGELSAFVNTLGPPDYVGADSQLVNTAIVGRGLKALRSAWNGSEPGLRVRRAGRWFLDSYLGTNELLSFVQATVALEILLGEEVPDNLLSLSELLRNRCAYLLGTSHSDREEIKTEFSKIYKVRSSIVHRGRSRLGEHDRRLLYKLRYLCLRVIQREIDLMTDANSKS